MYAYISGNITASSPTELVLENQGMGYLVQISLYTYTHLRDAKNARLYIYEHLREDTHDLYGFFTQEEKSVFMELIKVSGISAHSARLMLSACNPQELVQIITNKDAKRLEEEEGV